MEARRNAVNQSWWWIAVLAAGIGGACGEPTRPQGEPAQPPSALPPLVGDPGDVLVVTEQPGPLGRQVRTLGGIELPDDVDDAARVGSHGELVVAVSGPRSYLAIARDVARVAGARVLDATAIESTLPLAWQWEVAPDGRSICVHRAASRMVRGPHGVPPEALPEIARVAWIAIVPLDGSAASTLEVDGIDGMSGDSTEVLGWSEGRCVLGVHPFPEDRTLAFHPERPRDPDVLVSGRQRVRQLSPRGSMAFGSSGFDGEAIFTLHRLGAARGATRELLRDGETRQVAGYSRIGWADVTYAPDDAWLAVRRTEWRAPRFEVTLRVESPDGSRVLYDDAWRTGDATERSDPPERATFDPPSAAPSGQRVQYVRVGAGGMLERVVVDLADGAPRARVLGRATPPPRGGWPLAPLWSPDGDQLVVLDDARRVTHYDVRTGAVTDLGELPRNTITWRW